MSKRSQFVHIIGTEVEHDVYDAEHLVRFCDVITALNACGVARRLGIRTSEALLQCCNGGILYKDASEKAEHAGPECLNGTEAAEQEMAGTLMWAALALLADKAKSRTDGVTWILKTNTSQQAASSGGYQVNISMPMEEGRTFFNCLEEAAEKLRAFVASLQLITGTGVVLPLWSQTLIRRDNYAYAISPRGYHIGGEDIGSPHRAPTAPYPSKPMFINKPEPLADPSRFWRLGISALDSGILFSPTQLKLDLLLLLAEMVATKQLRHAPQLASEPGSPHPMRRISLDWRTRLELTNGRCMTALQIQWHYWRQVKAYVTHCRGGRGLELLEQWAALLKEFDTTEDIPRKLFGKVDWVTKIMLLDREAQKSGQALGYDEAEMRHFLYHAYHLNKAAGLCRPLSLLRRYSPPGTWQRVIRALRQPPIGTRAQGRGKFVTLLIKTKKTLGAQVSWTHVKTSLSNSVKLLDPAVPTTDELTWLMKKLIP
jgi:hypothetical protein